MITAIICTRNRSDMIRRAVESVLANDYEDFELIVIDQSDADDTEQELASLRDADKRLRFIRTRRVGLSAAYNTGISLSRGSLLAFTDDDCVAPPTWLRSIEQAFARTPDAVLLYGQVLAPADLRDAAGVLPQLPIPRRRYISRRHGFQVFGMGANFAMRRDLVDRVGAFDEVLGGGGLLRSSQDFDFLYRTYRAGLLTVLEPSVVVDHYGIRSAADWPKTEVAYGTGDGGFYMKHVRCGDLLATRLLAGRIVGQATRRFVKPILGRRHHGEYLDGLLQGTWRSFGFRVDRRRRMYVLPETV
jgi:glycosyltransferase involved in cell wall biosynthesis